jgi:hypothetical protein
MPDLVRHDGTFSGRLPKQRFVSAAPSDGTADQIFPWSPWERHLAAMLPGHFALNSNSTQSPNQLFFPGYDFIGHLPV